MRIQIVYSYPPSPASLEAMMLLDEIGTEGDDIEEQRAALIKQIEPEHLLRIEVHPVSFMDRGHYGKLIKEGTEWFTEKTGADIHFSEDEVDLTYVRNVAYWRAEMLCAVKREVVGGEVRYVAEVADVPYGATPQWERGFVPEEWVTLDGMANEMPVDLLDEWRDVSRQLNAGVLGSIPDFLALRRVTTSVLA